MSFVIKRGETVLADGLETGSIVTQGPDLDCQHEIDAPLRLFASAPDVFDRDGGALTVAFTISKLHNSMADAFDEGPARFRAVRGLGDLVIELTEGGSLTRWTGAGTGWKAVRVPAPLGYASALAFTVIVPDLVRELIIDGSVISGEGGTAISGEGGEEISGEG